MRTYRISLEVELDYYGEDPIDFENGIEEPEDWHVVQGEWGDQDAYVISVQILDYVEHDEDWPGDDDTF
jgi:hypothetical protein